MHFHDCFVRGCDASVLLNSTANNPAERDAVPNSSLAGFDVIDEIKAAIEKICPGVISCVDILALAARDSVSFQYKRPMWEVLTEGRDGKVSHASEVSSNIPSPFMDFTTLDHASEVSSNIPSPFMDFTTLDHSFAKKGLTIRDLVVLSGAHTIRMGHCNLFSNRLYNFTGRGDEDPSLNATYAAFLRTKCQNLPNDTTTTAEMDPASSLSLDTCYFRNLNENKGLFQSDAAPLTNNESAKIAQELMDTEDFLTQFGESMIKLEAAEVLGDTSGEIRRQCTVVNSEATLFK